MQVACSSTVHGSASFSSKVRPSVAVLLSTYNGDRYLVELVDSLLRQTYKGVRIVARDDGSSDRTMELLCSFVERGVLDIIDRPDGNVGVVASFFELLSRVEADVYMFCDQDDVWLPGKVQAAVSGLESVGLGSAALYHSDLMVVSRDLRHISGSFFAAEGVRFPVAYDLRRLLIQNCAVGCTVAFTRRLRDELLEGRGYVRTAAMHDWWVMLYAHCFGVIVCGDRPHILYRQHGGNLSGVSSGGFLRQVRLQFSRNGVAKTEKYASRVARQAEGFLLAYSDRIRKEDRALFHLVRPLARGGRVSGPFLSCLVRGVMFSSVRMNASFLSHGFVSLVLACVGRVVSLLFNHRRLDR